MGSWRHSLGLKLSTEAKNKGLLSSLVIEFEVMFLFQSAWYFILFMIFFLLYLTNTVTLTFYSRNKFQVTLTDKETYAINGKENIEW